MTTSILIKNDDNPNLLSRFETTNAQLPESFLDFLITPALLPFFQKNKTLFLK